MLHLNTVDSTQTYIKTHLDSLKNMDFVRADFQTQGKGRTGHNWESKLQENLTFSFLITNKKIVKHFNVLSIGLGVLILEFLQKNFKLHNLALKWPNDVLCNNKKIAGILMEGSYPDYIIVGIGINVNQESFVTENATSVFNENKTQNDINLVASKIEAYIKSNLTYFVLKRFYFIKKYNDYNLLKNRLISYVYNNNQQEGICKKILNNGSLQIKTHDNKLIELNADEISLVRKTN